MDLTGQGAVYRRITDPRANAANKISAMPTDDHVDNRQALDVWLATIGR